MSNLIKFVQTQLDNRVNSEIETTDNVSTALNYQFMYKQVESAIEELIIKYPNDPIVNELKQNLVRNLRPILELIQGGQDFNQ
jgi:cell fate (sporulation/competence/biofilm development) regulator YmcA (YheA/YmcA/DUF963 family)